MPQVYASTSSREVPAYTARGGTRPSSLHPGRPTGQAWGVSAARDVSRGDNQNVAMSAFVDQGVHVCNTIQFPVEDRTKLTFIVYSMPYICKTYYFRKMLYPATHYYSCSQSISYYTGVNYWTPHHTAL